jgi:nucleoside-diphosphate-sugar epimerase
MKIFVAGATGVLGKRATRLLVGAGHEVTGIARTPEKAEVLRAAGVAPVTVGLFDPPALTAAVAGHEVVANLATHIPDVTKAARSKAWEENDRIRTEGARNLVDAALAANADRYIQESIAFFYEDGASDWRYEDTPLNAPAFASTFQSAEAEAGRFTESGGVGVVLRFSMFYGAGASHTQAQLKAASRGISPFPGPKDAYQTFIHLDDAASAVVSALAAPAGLYNVCEDEPQTRGALAAAVSGALGKRPGRSIPGIVKLGGSKTEYFGRSVRVSNRKFKDATGWAPAYPSPDLGWKQVVTEASTLR